MSPELVITDAQMKHIVMSSLKAWLFTHNNEPPSAIVIPAISNIQVYRNFMVVNIPVKYVGEKHDTH